MFLFENKINGFTVNLQRICFPNESLLILHEKLPVVTSLLFNISSSKKLFLFLQKSASLFKLPHEWTGLNLENNYSKTENIPLSSWWCWRRCRTCSWPPPCPGRPRCSSAWSPPGRCRLLRIPWRYRTTSTWFCSELSSGLCSVLTVFERWSFLMRLWSRRWLWPVLPDNTDRLEYQPASRSCSKLKFFLHF